MKKHLQKTVLSWFALNRRRFYWRENRSPFITLVSEMMLQQTQTSRVEEKLPRFLAQFPDIFVLAKADNATIIRAWQGMGYNNRALRLRDCARKIVLRYNGEIPTEYEKLINLPGIGAYTASALECFAFGKNTSVIDINISRVYSRIFGTMRTTNEKLPLKEVHTLAENIYPHGNSSDWHEAIMDIGALFCTARTPKCDICPVRTFCTSAGKMREERPPKKAEPSFRGTPNRIWRGKMVEILRQTDAQKSVEKSDLWHLIFHENLSDAVDKKWFENILNALKNDRIIEISPQKSGKIHVSLATS